MRGLGSSEVRSLLEKYSKSPSRALGQNFLVDPNIAQKIALLASDGLEECSVLEIGPGLGALTVYLAELFPSVIAIEADRYLMPALRSVLEDRGVTSLVDLCHGDAFAADLQAVSLSADSWVVASNLPYNLAANLIVKVLEEMPKAKRMVVMVQREVAARLAARASTSDYSSLTVRVNYFATAKIAMKVSSTVFMPRPRVDSAVVIIDRHRQEGPLTDTGTYKRTFELVREGFTHRRQMLRRSLGPFGGETLLRRCEIEPTLRAENLDISQWIELGAMSLQTS